MSVSVCTIRALKLDNVEIETLIEVQNKTKKIEQSVTERSPREQLEKTSRSNRQKSNSMHVRCMCVRAYYAHEWHVVVDDNQPLKHIRFVSYVSIISIPISKSYMHASKPCGLLSASLKWITMWKNNSDHSSSHTCTKNKQRKINFQSEYCQYLCCPADNLLGIFKIRATLHTVMIPKT